MFSPLCPFLCLFSLLWPKYSLRFNKFYRLRLQSYKAILLLLNTKRGFDPKNTLRINSMHLPHGPTDTAIK